MNKKIGNLLLATVAIAAIVLFGGCKKKEQPVTKADAPTLEKVEKTATKTAEETKKAAPAVVEETKKTAEKVVAAVEQTLCPVLEGKIDKNVFVEYKGKKVYFCCADCKAKFQAEPEKYIAKLPQFKQ